MVKVDCTINDKDARKKLGLVVLQSDETVETEFRPFIPDFCDLYHTRITNHPTVTPETLARMRDDLPDAVSLLPPETHFDAIGYACTSGATVIGPDTISEIINGFYPETPSTEPISSVVTALSKLGATKIGFVSPYIEQVSAHLRNHLGKNGFTVVNNYSFDQETDAIVARIDEKDTLRAILEAGKDDVDAIFVSCTNLHSFGIIEEAEASLGKPVISSNLALLWHMMNLAEIDSRDAPGRLFRLSS